jgi:NAD(P)-dependent dehydrogenase (short-subunit alcohol dehydrogenase family)
MSTSELRGTTALVTGASRGFGRAIARAFHSAGANVVAVARSEERLRQLSAELDGSITIVAANVADPVVAGTLLDQYRPKVLVLNAGAAPLSRPIHQQTWQSFSRNWEVDVQQAFHWIREALVMPLASGSTVIAMSSGAAQFGSPLSGGYAGAKATIRFITGYAADESARAGLGIRFLSLLPRLTPATELGAAAVAAYARRGGLTIEEYLAQQPVLLKPEDVAAQVIELASNAEQPAGAYLFAPAGLKLLA